MTDSQFTPDSDAVGEAVEETASPTGAPEAPVEFEAVDAPDRVAELEELVAERTTDLQRLGAEYVNYKKRVDRDRDLARQAGIESVLTDFMPVLDSIALAREHGDIDGGFRMVADELEKVMAKHGLVSFGEVGEEFDPNRHDALMAVQLDEPVTVTTVSQVMQQGYQLKGRVVRPARVAVANP
ncbi:nucleotide exchange factor GrpE [Tessaracoccus sp. MC1865]|uniref:nucleotide exchange factor GrpE n=1 Tax=Tessaracoccus sp. MC1865 TaxID=2760310 RepID=UPI001602F04A|nr:nucleotide exchange factor GrpE [Tessaracoccus sp. MC1865]QTO37833.1 nucleotide exchange factor GrpE [Tessaracoccus sp. MC1865]